MRTIKYTGTHRNNIETDANIKFMVSSKGCMGCQDADSDIMFAIDSIRGSDVKIKQVFMSEKETHDLISLLTNALERNKDYDRQDEGDY